MHLALSPAPLSDVLSQPNEKRRMKFVGRIEIPISYEEPVTIWVASPTHFFGDNIKIQFLPSVFVEYRTSLSIEPIYRRSDLSKASKDGNLDA